uniref:phospholipase A2 inhibitor 25 kDa subunit-like n=1 Tax=Podarcis muralis TaxID=64176 RepID=UPI00109EF801|nr:phospholipase A2 inhibitor 25 kDa subunit-like [Podarcis muralis]
MILVLPYGTMVPLLVLCLLSPLLVASVDPPLKCIQGYNATQAPTDCTNGTDACVTIKNENALTGVAFSTTFYTCGGNDSCANAFTVTIGDNAYLRYTSACCTTADCNANLKWGVPPASSTKNGLFCSTGCFTETQEPCKGGKVLCTDAENTCISVTGTYGLNKDAKSFVLKGCGTRNVCEFKGKNVLINGTSYSVNQTTCENAKSSSTNHILGKSSFLLLLPSISSILFMKFLS